MLSPGGVEQAELAGSPGGLDASVHAELLEDVPDVHAERVLGLMNSSSAICRFVKPEARRASTIGLPIAEAGVVGHSGLR